MNIKKDKNQLVEYCRGLGYVMMSGCGDNPNNLNLCIKHNGGRDSVVVFPTQIELWYRECGKYCYRDYRYDMNDRTKDELRRLSKWISFDEIKDVIENGGKGIRWSWGDDGFQTKGYKNTLEECLELGKEYNNNTSPSLWL